MPHPAPLDDAEFDHAHAAQLRARRKVLWWLAGSAALLLALLLWGFAADEPPPDTSDLRVKFTHPPEEKNAYALLTKLVAMLPPEPKEATPEERHYARIFADDIEDRVAWNQDVVASVLGRYPADLADSVRVALDAPECEAPEIKSYDDSFPEVGRFRSLATTLTRHAALAWHAGDHARAAELNLLVLKFGSRVSQSRGAFITVLTGTAIEGMSFAAIQKHADSESVTSEALRTYLAQMGPYEMRIQDYHTAFQLEHVVLANMARDLRNQSSTSISGSLTSTRARNALMMLPGVWQPNRTIRWHAEFIRTYIAQIEPLSPGTPDPGTAKLLPIIESPWPRRAQNFTGRTLLASAAPSLGQLTPSCHRARANLRLTQIYVALRLYQLEHDNALPADLAKLVPAYLPAIPLDPFDGQPLRYDRSLTTIWSIYQKHLTITDADGDFPERGMPAHRLRFARPPVELPAFTEEPESASDSPPEPLPLIEAPKEQP